MAIHLIVLMCALSHSGFGGSRVAISLYALNQGASQVTIGVIVGLLLPPLFPGLPMLYLSALVLGSTFHFFFITVQGIAGGIGGAENRARNFALVGMGFSAAGFIGPFLAGLVIDHYGHRAA